MPPTSRSRSEVNFAELNTDELVEKILQNPKIHDIVNNYQVKVDRQSDEKMLQIVDELRNEIHKIKNELLLLEQNKNADLNRVMSQVRTENVRNLARLTQRLNRCCNKPVINLEPYVGRVLGDLLNDHDFLSKQKGLTDWLHALFVAKQDLEGRLSNITQNLAAHFDISVENTANRVMEKVVTKLGDGGGDPGSISDEQIRKVVQSALRIYDADRTGLVDYAMEPLGGEIVTTRCTESYSGTAVISVLGIPVWYPSISPRVVITPGINPGECWAFQNFPGFLVIKLAARVRLEAFSVEHVSRLLVPEGKIDSAPKEFEVFGLNSENDREAVKIGEYVYDYDGDPIQYFAAQETGLVFTMVEIRVKSNHGNPNYTCLYRFRVHGTLSSEPT
jgi:SUN domain-containing protein 1/2